MSPDLLGTITVTVANREVFHGHYREDYGVSQLFVPNHLELPVGAEVPIELVFVRELMTFRLRAVVRWKRAKGAKDLPAGVGLEFPPSEKRSVEALLSFVQSSKTGPKRRPRRFAVALRAEIALDNDFCPVAVSDISKGGAFIQSEQHPPIGTLVALRFTGGPDNLPLRLNGEVVWRSREIRPGFGVSFLPSSEDVEGRLQKLIEQITKGG